MDKVIKKILESGIVEDYCLGVSKPQDSQKLMELCMQYPEVSQYLEETQKTLESFSESLTKKAPTRSKEIIQKNILTNLKLEKAVLTEPDLMLEEFIEISRHSKAEQWNELLKEIEPPETFDNIFAKPLFVSEKEELILVWAKDMVPDEVHEDVNECFFLLEGTVDCYVDDQVFHMEKGDFMQIPLHLHHKVIVTSPTPGKAIRSRVSI